MGIRLKRRHIPGFGWDEIFEISKRYHLYPEKIQQFRFMRRFFLHYSQIEGLPGGKAYIISPDGSNLSGSTTGSGGLMPELLRAK